MSGKGGVLIGQSGGICTEQCRRHGFGPTRKLFETVRSRPMYQGCQGMLLGARDQPQRTNTETKTQKERHRQARAGIRMRKLNASLRRCYPLCPCCSLCPRVLFGRLVRVSCSPHARDPFGQLRPLTVFLHSSLSSVVVSWRVLIRTEIPSNSCELSNFFHRLFRKFTEKRVFINDFLSGCTFRLGNALGNANQSVQSSFLRTFTNGISSDRRLNRWHCYD